MQSVNIDAQKMNLGLPQVAYVTLDDREGVIKAPSTNLDMFQVQERQALEVADSDIIVLTEENTEGIRREIPLQSSILGSADDQKPHFIMTL